MPITGTYCTITQLDNAEGKEPWRAVKKTKSGCLSQIDVAFMLLDIASVVSVADKGSVFPKFDIQMSSTEDIYYIRRVQGDLWKS